jgi:hypothetical protein
MLQPLSASGTATKISLSIDFSREFHKLASAVAATFKASRQHGRVVLALP